MHTRKRDYAVNPRSPPKRRRRTSRREKDLLGLSSHLDPHIRRSLTSTNLKNISFPHSSPTSPKPSISLASPLIDEPVECTVFRTQDLDPSQSPVKSSPKSIGTISDLALGLSNPDLRRETCVPYLPDRESTYPVTLSETPFVRPGITLQNQPLRQIDLKRMDSGERFNTMMSDEERFQRDEIALASKLLDGAVKFEHLLENGSNFVEWRKNANRAMYELFSVEDYWDSPQSLQSYVGLARNKIATMVISRSIHNSLKDVTDKSQSAHDAMKKLQLHFSKGGRTHQFSLFNRLVYLRLDLQETEMITHMSTIDSIISELESTGFKWTSDSIKGFFYQLHMPAEMTREINKDLDAKFDEKNVNFNLNDIKSLIQIYLAREKTASETINISSLNTRMDNMLFKPSRPRQLNYRSHLSQTPQKGFYSPSRSQTDPNLMMQWRRGPEPLTDNSSERLKSDANPLRIPSNADVNVKAGLIQCFFCGKFGHTYRNRECTLFESKGDRTGAHWRD